MEIVSVWCPQMTPPPASGVWPRRAPGWSEIEATVVDLIEIVRGEFAENKPRKAFTPTEEVAFWRDVEPLERAIKSECLGGVVGISTRDVGCRSEVANLRSFAIPLTHSRASAA